MRVVRIDVENILGIEKLSVEPGALTVVTGKNGAGKTSFLEAIRAIAREGHDPSLLRTGAERGMVRLTLDDGSTMEKRITATGSSFEGRHPKLGKVSRARAWVDSLIDQLGVDPLALLSCPVSKRAEYLADVLSFEVSDAALLEATGRPLPGVKLPPKGQGLDRIEAARKALYDDRTSSNRTAKDKRTTVAQLRETLPPEEAEGEDAKGLREEKEAVEGGRAVRLAEAKRLTQSNLDASREAAEAEIEKVRAAAQKTIADLNAAAARRAERIQEEGQATTDRIHAESAPAIEALTAAIARAEATATEHARASKTREIIAAAESDASRAEAESSDLTAGIERLDTLRSGLLSSVPVAGLEIREGAVFVDGLPFERVNTARQIEIALRVAQLRAKDVPLLVSDHGEALDAANLAALKDRAKALGMHVILAVRTEGPLTVESSEAAA